MYTIALASTCLRNLGVCLFNTIDVPIADYFPGQRLHNSSGTDKPLGWVSLDYCVVTSRDTIEVHLYPGPFA